MPRFSWHRDTHLTKPNPGTGRSGAGAAALKRKDSRRTNEEGKAMPTAYVVQDIVSGVYLKARRNTISVAGNGFAWIRPVPNYKEATKFRTLAEAEHAMKSYVVKLNKKVFKQFMKDQFDIDVKLGPEFKVVHVADVRDKQKYYGTN
ncbi:hypothetical protein D3C71_448780 [compost metagenome]